MMKKGIFHIHTRHSYDCLLDPAKIVEMAVFNEINYLVICDHDSLQGSLEAREHAQKLKLPIEIPIAAEYSTDVRRYHRRRNSNAFQKIKDHRALCNAAKEHGAFTVLPHPYDSHDLDNIDFDLIDCVEIFNSRSSKANNDKAAKLATGKNKKPIYGCDAHLLKDILNCPFTYSGKTPFETTPEPLLLRQTSSFNKNVSQLIKSMKQKDGKLLLRVLINLSKNMLSAKKK